MLHVSDSHDAHLLGGQHTYRSMHGNERLLHKLTCQCVTAIMA